jgi:GAF domain-containing protein
MSKARDPLTRLQDLQHFLAGPTLEESLNQQAAMTAGLVGAASCSIMLLDSADGAEPRMSMVARHGGQFPDAAVKASIARGEGIAGRVLASGAALLVRDIGSSEFAVLARRQAWAGASLMCAPVRIDGKIVGVINTASAVGQPAFGETELRLLEVTALFIGKAIQVQQLQHLLDSRFAQLAMLQESREQTGEAVAATYHHPDEVARILARSFFREMTRAGFESAQIVGAASELIDQLNHHLHRNKKSSQLT